MSLSLISSSDYFKSETKVVFPSIIGSTETGEFLVVARLNDDNSLTAFITADGKNYAEAKFPADIKVDKQTAYTVLDVRSKQIFMHVTTSAQSDREFGSLLKSNYNGTMYVQSIDHVNRNFAGYIDFESIQSLEGISLLNVVSNADEVRDNGEEKKLKSMITYNDGAQWSYLTPPAVDSEGNKYSCNGKLEDCSLNLHSFTERVDPGRDTYSSYSAIGMLFGLGNVGSSLKDESDSETALFFTKDAGATWKEVKKGQYMWEFGDQGTLLVIVNVVEKTNILSYSIDEGDTWTDYQFATDEVQVYDIATVTADTSSKFLILSRSDDDKDTVYVVDFSGVYDRQCFLDFDDKGRNDDFEYWTLKHPFQADNCLFGREQKYLRRKADHTDCFIGAAPLSKGFESTRQCSCARTDFECDYNYVLASDGTCKLVKGLSPMDGKEVCSKQSDTVEWWEPTGYRKIPLSSCKGGIELDKWVSHACPGKSGDYDKKHGTGLHGFALFVVIFVPLAAFASSAWFVYDKGIRRNGGFSRFGEIRLDDDDDLQLIEENNVDRVVNKIVIFGVYSFGFLASVRRAVSAFLRRGVFSRFGAADREGYSRFGTSESYNDRIVDTEDDSIFRYHSSDDDAREIDSFLEHGIDDESSAGNDIQDDLDDDEDLENFDPDHI
ncbi:unnamed protein product [Ambrosiozyma monospora]|uniref:Unnamed protein product n=1 Tax=Ambrosiozyma monospora TaxID=43982 RepID=A0A9W6YU06_AMBMO|nr:unnamed protein product [Ambrosiozyma monospora]